MQQPSATVVLPPMRPITGYVRVDLIHKELQHSSADAEVDLWNALEFYSEIEDVGLPLVKARLPLETDHAEIYKRFRAFVRQGKSYYVSAKTLHYRSSSLLYYYSFLNLVKAWLLLEDPSKIRHKIRHGLIYDTETTNTDFDKEEIIVKPGVFPLLYEAVTGNPIGSKQKLNVVELLAYCTGIAVQYHSAGFGSPKNIPSIAAIMSNGSLTPPEDWLLIGVYSSLVDPVKFQFVKQRLAPDFEEVSLNTGVVPPIAAQVFGLDALATNRRRFFQQRTPQRRVGTGETLDAFAIIEPARRLLFPYIGMSYYPSDQNFEVILPYEPDLIPMSELLATYSIMFYLSSLVRYRPEYLERLLEHKPAWIIESFVYTIPDSFLRAIISKIIGKNIVIVRI